MSGWEIGDMAKCVHPREWHPHGFERLPDLASFAESLFFPQVGQTYRVYDVAVFGPKVHLGEDDGDLVYIKVDGFIPFFDARLFVKVLPSQEAAIEERKVEVPA